MKNWGVFIIIAMLAVVFALPFVGCTMEIEKPSSPNKLTDYYYDPHIHVTGDVEEAHLLKLEKLEKRDHIYLSELLSEDEVEDIKGVMIVTVSSKSIFLNPKCLENYYFSIDENNGLVSVCSDIDLHNEQAEMPVKGVKEMVVCASTDSHALEMVTEDGKSTYIGFINLLRSSGLFEYVRETVFEDDFAITTYNKHTCLANKLLQEGEEAFLVLEDDTDVYINEDSTEKMHWENGKIYLTDYKSPVKYIQYCSD